MLCIQTGTDNDYWHEINDINKKNKEAIKEYSGGRYDILLFIFGYLTKKPEGKQTVEHRIEKTSTVGTLTKTLALEINDETENEPSAYELKP